MRSNLRLLFSMISLKGLFTSSFSGPASSVDGFMLVSFCVALKWFFVWVHVRSEMFSGSSFSLSEPSVSAFTIFFGILFFVLHFLPTFVTPLYDF